MAANPQLVFMLKSPVTYGGTGTGQPWGLILSGGWRGDASTHSMGLLEGG